MIRYFCDNCAREMTAANTIFEAGPMIGTNKVTDVNVKKEDAQGKTIMKRRFCLQRTPVENEKGDVCLDCVLDEFEKLRTRAPVPGPLVPL